MDHLIIECTIGMIAVAVFQYRTTQPQMLVPVSVCVFLIFLSKSLMIIYDWAIWFWGVAVIGLMITYFVRFKRKSPKGLIDYFKWLGVISLMFYPLTIVSFAKPFALVPYFTGNLIIPLLAVIYLYDRWILKPEKMKRKFVVIVSIQSVLIFLLLLFAIFQKAEADKQREVAEMQMQEAITHRVIAEGLRAELDAARSDCGK